MYKSDQRKNLLLILACLVAFGSCLALISFFVHTLRLRTEYRKTAYEINESVLRADPEESFLTFRGDTVPLSKKALDYYDQVLLAENTMSASRKKTEPDTGSIILSFDGGTLTFTQTHPDGHSFCVCWEKEGVVKSYELTSGDITYMQMSSYATLYIRNLEKEQP